MSNLGTYTGSNTTSGVEVGYVSENQIALENINAGDSLVISASNMGVDNSSGYGRNSIGYVSDYQLFIDGQQ